MNYWLILVMKRSLLMVKLAVELLLLLHQKKKIPTKKIGILSIQVMKRLMLIKLTDKMLMLLNQKKKMQS